MRNTFSTLFMILSMVLMIQCTSEGRALNKMLNEMANDLNESVPVMLDQYTRFDGASVTPENIFRYHYTVLNTTNPDSLVANGLKSLKADIQMELSTNPQLQVFKQNNVVLEYVYMDEENRIIRSLQIHPEDYQ